MAVVQNPMYRENAARIQTELQALPGVDEAAERIVQLARERRPQPAPRA